MSSTCVCVCVCVCVCEREREREREDKTRHDKTEAGHSWGLDPTGLAISSKA